MNDNIFDRLESNNKEVVENAKQSLREQFTKVHEPWLLNGIYDYYLSTNSERALEILVNIREPHYVYLFDKLSDSIKCTKTDTKVQSLTVLGYIARSQPTWLYKLQEHSLLKDMLYLLKNEVELLPLISALFVLIVLLPMLPSTMGSFLKDIFDIFSRLASWNCNPGKIVEDQLIHMQVALHALFLRLYGMFPCNFLSYLRNQYKEKNKPVFVHTIKPMLHTVRMHPSLVTASKDTETTTERWRKMKVHDVIVECERFSLDLIDRCPHDSCQYSTGFRSRSGTSNSTIEPQFQLQSLKGLTSIQMPAASEPATFFTPSLAFPTPPITESVPTNILQIQGVTSSFPSQEGTSPPEAAIEATPETTPIRDYHHPIRQPPSNSTVARALTTLGTTSKQSGMGPRASPLAPPSSAAGTPSHSQPSSPMRPKDHTPGAGQLLFAYPQMSGGSRSKQKVDRLLMDRLQAADGHGNAFTPVEVSKSKNLPPPSSPLRIIHPEAVSRYSSNQQRIESPLSQEDEEVLSIVSKHSAPTTPRQQPPSSGAGNDLFMQDFDDDEDDGIEDIAEEEQEQAKGSPCTAGGLHMPNSKSMNNFAKRVQRLRHHSQCNPEPADKGYYCGPSTTGSSPGGGPTGGGGSGSGSVGGADSMVFGNSTTVRRAVSCPEMKKSTGNMSSAKDNIGKPLNETDEETPQEKSSGHNESNGSTEDTKCSSAKIFNSNYTQTENFWPYEHLFLAVFPSLECNDYRPSPVPSPAPFNMFQEKNSPSVYDLLDRYIETAVHLNDRNTVQNLRDQLQLVHQQYLFERHRREIHAYRNRRLLSDAKSTRLLEECNSALRDTVQLQEKYLDNLRSQLEQFKRERLEEEKKLNRTVQYWEDQCKVLQEEGKSLRVVNDGWKRDFNELKTQCAMSESQLTQLQADLLDAIAELNVARQQAKAGEKAKKELEQVSKELLMKGELLLKYQERLEQLESRKVVEEELIQVREAYKEEIRAVNQHLEGKMVALDSYKARANELEHALVSKDEIILSQKQMLSSINEQHFEKLEAVESKYQTQLTINRALEEKLLELRARLDSERCGTRNVHSPETSSCHEVNVTTTGGGGGGGTGGTTHSSPLSASLASSEGSSLLMHEVKNLQAIVDQKESTSQSKLEEIELFSDSEGQIASSSTKTD